MNWLGVCLFCYNCVCVCVQTHSSRRNIELRVCLWDFYFLYLCVIRGAITLRRGNVSAGASSCGYIDECTLSVCDPNTATCRWLFFLFCFVFFFFLFSVFVSVSVSVCVCFFFFCVWCLCVCVCVCSPQSRMGVILCVIRGAITVRRVAAAMWVRALRPAVT